MKKASIFSDRYAVIPNRMVRLLPNAALKTAAFIMLRTNDAGYLKVSYKDISKSLHISKKSVDRSLHHLTLEEVIQKNKKERQIQTIQLLGDFVALKAGKLKMFYVKVPDSLIYNKVTPAQLLVLSYFNAFDERAFRSEVLKGKPEHRSLLQSVAKEIGLKECIVYRVLSEIKKVNGKNEYGYKNIVGEITAYEFLTGNKPEYDAYGRIADRAEKAIAVNDITYSYNVEEKTTDKRVEAMTNYDNNWNKGVTYSAENKIGWESEVFGEYLEEFLQQNEPENKDPKNFRVSFENEQSDEILCNEDYLDSENSPETSDQLNSSKASVDISYNEKGWTKPSVDISYNDQPSSVDISYNEKGSSVDISYNDKTVVKSTIAQDSAGPEGETSIKEGETSLIGIETSLYNNETRKNTSYSYMQNRRYAPLLQSKNSSTGQNLVNSKSGEILLDKEPCNNTSVNLQQSSLDGLHTLDKDVSSIHSCNNNQLTTDNILPTNNSGDNILVSTVGSVSSSNKHTSDDRLHNLAKDVDSIHSCNSNKHTSDDRLHNLAKDVDSIHSCNNNQHTSDNRQQTTIDGYNSPATYDSSPNLTKDRIRISAKDKRRMFYSRKINKDKLHNPSAYKSSIKRLTTFENLLLSKWNDSALKAHRQFTTSGRENKYFVESIKSIRSLQKGKLLVSSDLQSFFDRKFTNSDILQTFEKFFEYISCSDYGVTPSSLQYYKNLSISDFIFNSGKYTKTGPQSLFQQFYVRQLTYVTNVEDIFPAGTKRLIQLYTKDFKSGYGNVGAASSTDFTKASNKIFSMYPDYRDKLLFTTSAKNLRLIEMIDWLHQSILYRVKGIKDKIFISSRWYFSEKTFEDTYLRYLTDHNLFKYEATVCSKSSAPRRAPLRENRPIFDINNPDSWLSSQP